MANCSHTAVYSVGISHLLDVGKIIDTEFHISLEFILLKSALLQAFFGKIYLHMIFKKEGCKGTSQCNSFYIPGIC